MKNVDYSKYRDIKIEDLPISWPKNKDDSFNVNYVAADYYFRLKKHNVETLEDLFLLYERCIKFNHREIHGIPVSEIALVLSCYEDINLNDEFKLLVQPFKKLESDQGNSYKNSYDRKVGLSHFEYIILKEYYYKYEEYIVSAYGDKITIMDLIEIFLQDKNHINSISNLIFEDFDERELKADTVLQNLEIKANLYRKFLKSNKLYNKITFSNSKKTQKDQTKANDYSKFSEIEIKDDLPISLYGREKELENMGIKTLEDLFVAYENGSLIRLDKKLRGSIEFLLAYYTGFPLIAEKILLNNINIRDFIETKRIFNTPKDIDKTFRIGLHVFELIELFRYCRERFGYIISKVGGENLSLMTLLNIYVNDTDYQMKKLIFSEDTNYERNGELLQNLRIKTSLYTKTLNFGKSDNSVVDSVAIREYKSQIESLLGVRDMLDAQIALLESKVSKVEKTGEHRR